MGVICEQRYGREEVLAAGLAGLQSLTAQRNGRREKALESELAFGPVQTWKEVAQRVRGQRVKAQKEPDLLTVPAERWEIGRRQLVIDNARFRTRGSGQTCKKGWVLD